MEQNQIREWMREGIEAARNNNKIIARDFFRRVLEVDPDNELAWMWMAQAADRTPERRQALERVLEINPNNERAIQALQRIEQEMGGTYTPTYSITQADNAPAQPSAPVSPRSSSSRQPVEQQRDWLRPVERQQMPRELWRSQRQDNSLILYLLGVVALALIGFGGFLLLGYLEDENEAEPTNTPLAFGDIANTETAIALTPTVTPIPPTLTPINTSVLLGTPTATGLPPTLAPTLTSTPIPTVTNTPPPTEPDVFRMVYAASSAPGEPSRLYIANGDGSEPQFVELTFDGEPILETASPDDDRRIEILDPALSPSGGFIAFTMDIDGIQEIFVAPDTGGEVFQVTLTNASETRGVSWNVDGETLAYHSNADGDFDIYLVPYTRDEPLNFTDNLADDRYPSWSPDGNYLAIASDRESTGNLEIFVINYQGEITPADDFGRTPFDGECQLTNSSGDNFMPAWSPDSRQIAFISTRDRDNDLYIMNADGSNERLLSVSDNSVDWQERSPAWAPDGSWIVVSSNRLAQVGTSGINDTYKLWIVTPRGDLWQQITEDNDANESAGAWFAILPEFRPDVSDFSYSCAS